MKMPTSAFILLPSSLGRLAARLGFEPRQTDSESAVLPLHNRASDWALSLVTPFRESSRQANVRQSAISLAPGFSRVLELRTVKNRFNGFSPRSMTPEEALRN